MNFFQQQLQDQIQLCGHLTMMHIWLYRIIFIPE